MGHILHPSLLNKVKGYSLPCRRTCISCYIELVIRLNHSFSRALSNPWHGHLGHIMLENGLKTELGPTYWVAKAVALVALKKQDYFAW